MEDEMDISFDLTVKEAVLSSSTLPTDDSFWEHDLHTVWLPIIGTIVILIALFAAAPCVVHRQCRKRPQKYSDFSSHCLLIDRESQNPSLLLQLFDRTKYEIEPGAITIDWTKILGRGQFGVVLQGKEVSSGRLVAVKTVYNQENEETDPNRSTVTQRQNVHTLLSELKILANAGRHEHIVSLIGAQKTRVSEGVLFLFVEYCPLGDLETLLREKRNNFRPCVNCGRRGASSRGVEPSASASTPSGYIPLSAMSRSFTAPSSTTHDADSQPLSPCDLIRWSAQTASAMAYLASRRVIRGDLATRNILLLNKNCVKLTDFGLAKKLYRHTNYVNTPDGSCMPWRSMAPESLRDLSFTSQSDVWSFGVTLWEIFSLGAVPYEDDTEFRGTAEFIRRLCDGHRLSKPDYIPVEESIYEDIILHCRSMWPEHRPSFADLHRTLIRMEQACWIKGGTNSITSSEDEITTRL